MRRGARRGGRTCTFRSSRATTAAARGRAPRRSSRRGSRGWRTRWRTPTRPFPAGGRGGCATRASSCTAGRWRTEARELNRGFCRWVVSGKPFVTLKLAVSLDGQIAAAGGDSRWITGEAARRRVHRMRSEADAVLVGGETARRDDPLLTARVPGGHDPRRVILTSRPAELARGKVFREPGGRGDRRLPEKRPGARPAGGPRTRGPGCSGSRRAAGPCARGDFLAALGAEGVTSLLVEGGGRTAGWLAAEGAIDRYVVFVAPCSWAKGSAPCRAGRADRRPPGSASPSPRSAASAPTSKSRRRSCPWRA